MSKLFLRPINGFSIKNDSKIDFSRLDDVKLSFQCYQLRNSPFNWRTTYARARAATKAGGAKGCKKS